VTPGHDDRRERHPEEYQERTEGGDPVCWLDRVCDECGAMREDTGAARCARCGTPFPGPGSGLGSGPGQQPPAL
jgi:hypothetical protein